LLEDIDIQYPEDADKVRLWNDIKTHRIITALDGVPEFKEFLTLHVIGNPILPAARDLVAAVTQFANANRRLGRDLKAGEVQANVVNSDRAYSVGPCFNCKGAHLSANCPEPRIVCRQCGKSGHRQEFCDQISKMRPTYGNDNSQDARKNNKGNNDQQTYEQFRKTQTYKPYAKPISTSTSSQSAIKRRGNNPIFQHQKSRKSRDHLVRLADSTKMEEPCLNRAYLVDLLNTEETFVDFYQDDLCAMSDALQDKDDNDEVWYPTEDFDDFDSTLKTEPTASYLNLLTSKLPPKSPVIYSTSTYITNNSIKPKQQSLTNSTITVPRDTTNKAPSRTTEKASLTQFSTLRVSNISNSPVFNAQQKSKTDSNKTLNNQPFYAPPLTHYYQPIAASTILYTCHLSNKMSCHTTTILSNNTTPTTNPPCRANTQITITTYIPSHNMINISSTFNTNKHSTIPEQYSSGK
jgi:hypothetical protein